MAVVNEVKPEDFNWNEGVIVRGLASTDKFGYSRNLFCIPNVSHGFFTMHEADLLVCSHAGYLTEVEAKVTMSDWLGDKKKLKWSGDPDKPFSHDSRIKYFWYAAPLILALQWKDVGIPEFAGVLGMSKDPLCSNPEYTVVKPAEVIKTHRKLRQDEIIKALRLAALRYWDCSDRLWEQIKANDHLKESIKGER